MSSNGRSRLAGRYPFLRPQGYQDSSDERPARTAYVPRAGYSFLCTTDRRPYPTYRYLRQRRNVGYDLEATFDPHNARRRLRNPSATGPPELQSAPVGLPQESEVTLVVAALVYTRDSIPSPSQGDVPPAPEAYAGVRAGGYTLQDPGTLISLGSSESSIVIENLASPEQVASPVVASLTLLRSRSPLSSTSSSSNAPSSEGVNHPTTPNATTTLLAFGSSIRSISPPCASPDYSPTFPGHYPPSVRDSPTVPENTSSSTMDNPPISQTAPPGYWPASPEYYSYTTSEYARTSITLSPTKSLPREPNSSYPTLSSSSHTTYSSQWDIYIELPYTGLASLVNHQPPSPSEPILSDSGYDAGSERYASSSTMYSDYEEEEGRSRGADTGDVEAGPEESPEIWLTWVEARVDTVSEQEESVEAEE